MRICCNYLLIKCVIYIVLFPCSDTATRSGMYCSIATTIDRCKTEGVVDVFQVVKALRVHKPGAVPSVVSSFPAYSYYIEPVPLNYKPHLSAAVSP